jgi:hypothetical protein
MSGLTQQGSTQTGVKNLYVGAEVFALASVTSPFVGTLRLVIVGLADDGPVNWTVTVLQDGLPEEWHGETASAENISLVIENILFAVNGGLSITLEGDESADTNVLVSASLFVQNTPLTGAGIRTAVGLGSANLDTQFAAIPSAATNASATRTNLATELARIDANISSRLSSLGSTAPTGWINDSAIDTDAYETIAAYTSDKVSNEWSISAGQWNTVNYVIRESVWNRTVRTLSDFSFSVTVGTNNDKTGYALTPTTGLGNQTTNITGNLTGSVGSVTGNVGGNVVGSVASVVGSVDSVTSPVTVGTNNDKTGYSLSQSFPSNFAAMGINSSGHVERVVLVDTTTTNSDMRGTDSAALASDYNTTRAGYLDKLNISGTLANSDDADTYKATGFAVAGDAMTLTSEEREATAVVVESHLLDEGDTQMLINAIVGAIGNTNIDEAVLVAAIRADLERSGGNLNTLIARITGSIRTASDDVTAETAQTTAIRNGLALESTLQSINDKTESLTFTVDNQLDVNVKSYNGTLQSNGDLPLKIDAVKSVVDSIVVKTDNLPSSPASTEDVQVTLTPDITVNPTELSNDSINTIRDSILSSQILVDDVVYFASSGAMTIDSLSGSLGLVNRLNDCLMRITDNSGNIQLRWIRSHFHSGGRAGFNPDLDFNPTPQVGDRVEIFNMYRGSSNVVNWRGDVPNTLTSGRVNSLVGAMSNNVITTASINNEAFTEAKFSSGFFSSIWNVATRTLTSISNSSGINTLLERITGLIRTKSEDDIADQEILEDIWTYDTRTLTSDNNLTAQEVWEYSTRTITNDVEVEVDFTDILASLSQINTKISSTVVNIISPLSSDGTSLTVIQGDDYLVGDGRNILFTGDIENQWVDLTDSTVVFGISDTSTLKEVSVVTPVGTQQLSLELTKENTSIPQGSYKYDVQATLSNGSVVTLFRGNLEIIKSYT